MTPYPTSLTSERAAQQRQALETKVEKTPCEPWVAALEDAGSPLRSES